MVQELMGITNFDELPFSHSSKVKPRVSSFTYIEYFFLKIRNTLAKIVALYFIVKHQLQKQFTASKLISLPPAVKHFSKPKEHTLR